MFLRGRTQNELRAAYAQTFNTDQGRVVLADLMREGCVLSPVIVNPHQPDVGSMAFLEGKRNMALRILDLCKLRDMHEIQTIAELYYTQEKER